MRLSPLDLLKAAFTHPLTLGRTKAVPAASDSSAMAETPATPKHCDTHALAMHAGLCKALDAVPGSRKVLRHLATVEHHLWEQGALFIADLPLAALQRIGEQLERIAQPAFAPGLAPLRGCIAAAIASQERWQREQELRLPPSSFLVDHKLEVVEVTVTNLPSDFLQTQPGATPGGR